MQSKIIFISTVAVVSCGCATFVTGTHQDLKFTTGDITEADCKLFHFGNNPEKQKNVQSFQTPATLSVKRSSKALVLECSKNGYETAKIKITPRQQRPSTTSMLAGGVTGSIVDSATGASYKYPERVYLPMKIASEDVSKTQK